MREPPSIALVGPVNVGKTSVIATLVEDDGLRIDQRPGTTMECQPFDLKRGDDTLIVFYDTPGFQNARGTLQQLRILAGENAHPLDVLREFVEQFGQCGEFREECKLFQPIIGGAGIVYVVDAAEPLRPVNEIEMEILRITGQPVMGIINSTDDPVHRQQWDQSLRRQFPVWDFNAHTATFRERIGLIRHLPVEQRDAPALDGAVARLEENWKRRTRDCATTVSELLIDCLRYRETRTVKVLSDAAKRELEEQYKCRIRKMERDAHVEILRIFRHHKPKIAEALFADQWDLFAEESWRLLGLSRKQLAVLGGVVGLTGGALIEGVLFGHGLGLPTLVGATAGAVVGWLTGRFGGKVLIDVKTPLPARIQRFLGWETLGAVELSVGPNRVLNFPFGLIDRAMAVHLFGIQRTHARQDTPVVNAADLLDSPVLKNHLTAHWDSRAQKACNRIFEKARNDKVEPQDREELIRVINERLEAIGDAV